MRSPCKKVWSHGMKTSLGGEAPGYGYSESPLVDGKVVVATPGGKKGALASFDKKTGTLKWRSTACTYGGAYSSIVVVESGGVRQYIQAPGSDSLAGDHVVGVRASDGKLLWDIPFRYVVATPIYQNGCVFVSCSRDCNVLKLVADGDQCKAELLYAKEEGMRNHIGGSVLVGDYLYGYSYLHGLSKTVIMCQDFRTGKVLWTREKRRGTGSVLFAEGRLYCRHAAERDGANSGDLVLLEATPAGYREKGKLPIPERTKLPGRKTTYTPPVVANGKLYVRDQDLIFCYDVRKPQ
jgi:outer membrane protein assembly factor BamB